jgi:hypothetical protein
MAATWRARAACGGTGMQDADFAKPIIAMVNSYTQFVPCHAHLKDLGQLVARAIECAGGVAKEFNIIAVDNGIAMDHDGMLYSLPSLALIADSVGYMVNAHCPGGRRGLGLPAAQAARTDGTRIALRMAIGMFALVAPLKLLVCDISGTLTERVRPTKITAA